MRLEIRSESLGIDFCQWLRDIVADRIKGSVNEAKLIPWNDYLNNGNILVFTNRKSILAKEIIYKGADSLRVVELPQKFLIEINPKYKMPGVENKKVLTLCKLINYGNAEMKGYPIFSNIMSDIADNINAYIDLYMLQDDRREF